MSSLLETLVQQLGGGTMGQISRQLGADERTAGNATGAAVSTLIGALARNASQQQGAESLHKALSKDHDGSLLDNLAGFLGNPQGGPGEGILRHVLGARRPQVEAGLSKTTGLDAGSVGRLLTMLAPVVMAALGKTQRQGGMDSRALAGFLGQERQTIERREPQAAGLMGRLLDTDGDGDVDLGDLAKHGVGLLGKLFEK
jgi:hypothetical protein